MQPAQQRRIAAERLLLVRGVGRVLLRHHPLRGALEQRVLRHALGERAGDLHRGRARTDHADAPAVERHRVVPARAVERRALERVDALELRDLRVVQHAGRRDDDVDLVAVAARGLDLPAAALERAALDLVAEAEVRHHAVLLRGALEIGLDLSARRIAVAPARVQRERVAVQVRGHVAAEPGIGVLAPGAAEPARLLVDGEVAEPGLLELDRREHAGHAGAEDRDAGIAHRVYTGRRRESPSAFSRITSRISLSERSERSCA